MKKTGVCLLLGILIMSCCISGVVFAGNAIEKDKNRLIYSFKDAGNKIDEDHFEIIGDEQSQYIVEKDGGLIFQNHAEKYNAARLALRFDVSKDDDIVFDITFSSFLANRGISGNAQASEIYLGLAFGLQDGETSLDGANVGFVGSSAVNSAVFQQGQKLASYTPFDAYSEAYNERVTMRVLGKSDGNIEVYRGYKIAGKEEKLETLLGSYDGFETGGNIAFTILCNESAALNSYKFKLADFNLLALLDSDAYTPRIEVGINESRLQRICVGMTVNIPVNVKAVPNLEKFKEYAVSVEEGPAKIENGKMVVEGAGNITLKVVSKYDGTENTFTFTALGEDENPYQSFSDSDNFYVEKSSLWQKVDPFDRMVFNESGLSVMGDFAGTNYDGTRLVSNVEFSSVNAADGIVFDVKFTSYGYVRDEENSWGFAFGLPSPNSSLNDEYVYYFKMTASGVSLVHNGAVMEPSYLNVVTLNNAGYGLGAFVYATQYADAFTVRLVGKSNGTLDLYRSQGTYEKLSDLKATFQGVNVDGYCMLTTNCTDKVVDGNSASAKYGAVFNDFGIKGNAVDEGNAVIESVSIDKEPFLNIMQKTEPFRLIVFMTINPSFDKYKLMEWTVVSGPAEITDGNLFKPTGSGNVVLKVKSTVNPDIQEEYEFEILNLEIESVRIDREKFQDITYFTQPILLTAAVVSSLNIPKYEKVVWEVEGDGVILIGERIRFLREGEVTLKAVSAYDGKVFDSFMFHVGDPFEKEPDTLLIVLLSIGGILILGAGVTAAVFVVRRKKQGNKREI